MDIDERHEIYHKAREIVTNAFKGKLDKGGKPYLTHLLRVSQNFEACTDEEIVALLHDLLEDCPEWTEERLREEFSDEIVDAVICLTKKPGEYYDVYIKRVKTNLIAVRVKIADLEDNMDIKRLSKPLTHKDWERLKKYHDTWIKLKEFIDKE